MSLIPHYGRALQIILSLSLLSTLTLSGCTASQANSQTQNNSAQKPLNTEVLVSSRLIAEIGKDALTEKLKEIGIAAQNGIKIYRVSYNTLNYDETPVLASGIVIIPDTGAQAFPWITLQHGTLTSKAEAPSLRPSEGLAEGSQGFVTVVADYLGYGDSAQVYHPYILEKGYTTSIVDMMRAARELASTQSFTLGTLFLKGYSEGGYATASLQKALETTYAGEFTIRASSPSAGPLDVEQTGLLLVQKSTVNAANLPFLILSYNHWLAGDTMPLESFFVPNVSEVTTALSGAYTSDQIAKMLPTATTDLIRGEFISDFSSQTPSGAAASQLRPLLRSQSLLAGPWYPVAPTRIYHCEDDQTIPVAVTENAARVYKAAGAPVEAVIISSPKGSTYEHGNCPGIFAPIQWFGQILAQDAAIGR